MNTSIRHLASMTALSLSLALAPWTARAADATAAPAARAASAAPAADVAAVLKAVDRYRTGADALEVDTRVTTIKPDGSVDKERSYTVYLQTDRRTLVLMRSPAEQDQKLLMLGDDFWLVLPGSQRPMRITATQKLLGDASTGDIATMRWADDYAGSIVGEEACGTDTCLRLDLTATRKGVSYTRIELWVNKARLDPVRADLYVQSGKLAKQARFVMDNPRAPTQVVEMVLEDQLSSVKETRIRYVARKPKTVPSEWFNPTFLATNRTLG